MTYYASIWRLLRRFGVLSCQLDDATQEVFWVASRRLSDIEPGREHSFLYGVALRVAASEVRRQKAALPVVDLERVPAMIDERPSPEDQLVERQARVLLDDVLNRLPLELRTVFVLCEIEGLEVRQVAEIEEIPVGTASSRLRRAREEFSAVAKRVRARLIAQGGRR
jgi:RNA polymerase sigma-70 factor (ECF subfamily)